MSQEWEEPVEGRYTGRISGLRVEAEACPDSCGADCVMPAAMGGAAGFVLSWLLRASPVGRLLWIGAGVGLGALAGRHHLNIDWDPDRLRDGDKPNGDPQPEAR